MDRIMKRNKLPNTKSESLPPIISSKPTNSVFNSKKSSKLNTCSIYSYYLVLIILTFPVIISCFNFLAWNFCSKELSYDEIVEFLPTYGYLSMERDSIWNIDLAAIVYKNDTDGFFKRNIMNLVTILISYYNENMNLDIFSQRSNIFLRDFQRGKFINVTLCTYDPTTTGNQCLVDNILTNVLIGPTAEDGLIKSKVSIETSIINRLNAKNNNMFYIMTNLDERRDSMIIKTKGSTANYEGESLVKTSFLNYDRFSYINLIPYKGISVISDIDDTIKVTQVGNHAKLLEHTFLKEFQIVPEVYNLYKQWNIDLKNSDENIHFHYVSSSPWPMANILSDWIRNVKYPTGTMHLKKFRLELFEPWGIDLTLFNLFKNPTKYKVSTITNIISNFPSRKFILVGDSSEKDPEIYGIITRMHPEKILCAIIRNVSTRPIHISRMQQAFLNVSSSKYITIDSSLDAKSQLNILKINKYGNCF